MLVRILIDGMAKMMNGLRLNKHIKAFFYGSNLKGEYKYMKKNLYNMCKNASGQSNINAQELQNIKIYITMIQFM